MNDLPHIELPKRRHSFLGKLRNNFLAGIVVIAPIGLTVWLIWTVIGWVDSWVWPFVPQAYQPEALINHWFGAESQLDPAYINLNVRGLGVIVFLIVTILTGWIAKGILGRSFIAWGEGVVSRMPVVRSVYNGAKQLAETVFAQSESSFDRACLVEYPRKGLWAIGFISTKAKGEIATKVPPEDTIMSVFLPTTPNPTSGFLLYVPDRDIIYLDMTVEDAAKLIISAGLVYPSDKKAPSAEAVPVKTL